MSSLIGKDIHGYHVLSEIGRGAMGVVYKAKEIHLGRTVALKMMEASISENESFLKKFRNEAKAQALSENPNIVKIHAFLDTEYGFLIVMEYVDGMTLAEEIFKRGPIPFNRSISIVKQILNAIDHAHKKAGIIHCDIKPRNILITEQDQVKMMDFGLAQFRDSSDQTRTRTRAGTLCYMSPEQASKGLGAVDERSDIYSIGMTIYEMLAGRTPFEKDCSEYDILDKTIHGNIPPPTKYNPNIPKTLSDIVMKAIHKDPDKRYQSAHEMLDHVNYFMEKQQTKYDADKARDTQIITTVKRSEIEAWMRRIMIVLFLLFITVIVILSKPFICTYLSIPFICKTGELEAPVLVSPLNNDILEDRNPIFDWSDIQGAEKYDIQVARDSDFNLLEIKTTVDESKYQTIRNLKEGTYYWRVRSRDGNNTSKWNNLVQVFTISKLPLMNFGKLKVTSNPAGAKVYLNNQAFGIAPKTIDSLIPGQYSVRLIKHGYSTWTGDPIEIEAGSTAEISATLMPLATAKLILDCYPEGVIYLNGHPIQNNTEKILQNGNHTVTFTNSAIKEEEYNSKTISIDLSPGVNKKLTCYFEFYVSVQTLDEFNQFTWAMVNIDGRDIDNTPFGKEKCPPLPAGKHIISVHRSGFRSIEGNKILHLYPTIRQDSTVINLIFHLKSE